MVAQRWSRLFGPPAIVTAIVSLIALAGTTLLFRQLPKADVGTLALLFALVETLTVICMLGQPTTITRRYSQVNSEGFAWRKDLFVGVLLATPILAVGLLVATFLYTLGGPSLRYVGFSVVILVPTFLLTWMINSRGYYVWSSLFLRLPNALIVVPALIAILNLQVINLSGVLIFHVLIMLPVVVASYVLASRKLELGSQRISPQERKQGLYFLANEISLVVSTYGLLVIAGAILSPALVATYAAVAIFLRAFRLLSGIQVMVLIPELIRTKAPRYGRLFVASTTIALGAGLLIAILGPAIARWAYSGKFEEGTFLIPWLAMSGALLLMEVLPRSYIFGRLGWPKLRRFIVIQILIMMTVWLISLLLIWRAGVLGIALSTTLALLIRNILAYGYFLDSIRSPEKA